MNKCQRCGAFVPVEKAFCPNCSEPMEPEEAPNRLASFSSEMRSTVRDDPEGYGELLAQLKQKTEVEKPEKPAPDPAPVAPPATGYNFPGGGPPNVAPPAQSSKPYLVLGISAALLLIIVFVVLFALKLI